MWLQILTLTMLTATAKSSHGSKNDTDANPDVIVTYAGHAEALDPPKPIHTEKPKTETQTTDTVKILIPESYASYRPNAKETTPFYEDETESVVFIPNEKPVYRNSDYHSDKISVGDIIERKTVNDIFNDKKIRVETEAPPEDILFISGKNNENVDKPPKKERTYKHEYVETRRTNNNDKDKKSKKIPLICSNLDCNNTVNSVCGAKMDNKHLKYRVFLNECYFRRVNCDFKYEANRYKIVANELCKTVGYHNTKKTLNYDSAPLPGLFRRLGLPMETPAPTKEAPSARRTFESRRSLNVESDGSFCSHPCPPSCPEDYAPECAASSTGLRQVFLNHCKLDYHSCTYGTVWHKRPLAECVGSQKSDIRQNRAFIGWMQRVGIVDGKGRLNMEDV